MRFTVDRLDHLVLNVRDIEISAAWYQRVLGMEREDYGPDRRTALKFGGQKIDLREVDPPVRPPLTLLGALCFITAVGQDELVGHLHECGVVIESGPTHGEGALGPYTRVCCRDPDGNLIEIASYLA